MMMGFLLLMIFGLMHLVMFAITRYMLNYAAFAASRAAVVGNSPDAAAQAVMNNLNWFATEGGTQQVQVQYTYKGLSSGYEVRTRVPFGMPIYEWIDSGGIELVAFAPASPQANAPSGGDNGE